MFKWLNDELSRICTPKFHLVGGRASADLRRAVEASNVPLPPSYKSFVLEFGETKLYRKGSTYLVQVFAVPVRFRSERDEALLHFARTEVSLAYFKDSLLVPGTESPVFEWRKGRGLRKSTDGFEEWLIHKCSAARKRFRRDEWQAIERGPQPFDPKEKAIVETRKQFKWRVVGIADNGDVQFEVQNGSSTILAYLTIGVRGKHGKVDGGIWLPISSILPGETRIIEKACYKDLLSPEEVEAFEMPDPEPEDRDRYWEFKPASTGHKG